jgi:O-antigen/teichoic acid export membrane protein
MRALVYSALARILGFVPQGIATLVASHLIIKHYGIDAFSSYALIISVLFLIPLGNLGAGASVTQVVAAHGVESDLSLRAGTTAVRVMFVSGAAVSIISVVLGLCGLWPRLLGQSSGANGFVAAAVVLFALSFIPGLGQSVLLATGRNYLTISVQVFTSVLIALFIWILYSADLDSRLLVVVPSGAIFLVNLATFAVSQRITGFSWVTAMARAPRRREFPGARSRSLAVPLLITSLALPMAFLADRIVLSQVSSASELSRYALVLQLFAPVTGLLVATSQPLWPMITRARVEGTRGPRMIIVLGGFFCVTVLVSAVLVLLADPIGRAISNDKISLGYGLPALAAAVTLLQAVALPLSMGMVDPKGARLVAWTTVLTVPLNLYLSVVLAREWGAPGPLVSMLGVSLIVQIIPWLVFSVRRSRSGVAIAVL